MNGIAISIVGNATRDVELKYTNSGQAVAKVGVAVSRRYQKAGEWTEETSFVDVVAWGQLAENMAESVRKGTRLFATGRFDQRSFEHNGEKRTAWELTADECGPSLRWATAVVTRAERTAQPAATGGEL